MGWRVIFHHFLIKFPGKHRWCIAVLQEIMKIWDFVEKSYCTSYYTNLCSDCTNVHQVHYKITPAFGLSLIIFWALRRTLWMTVFSYDTVIWIPSQSVIWIPFINPNPYGWFQTHIPQQSRHLGYMTPYGIYEKY